MTKEQLKQIRSLKSEIKLLKRQLEDMEYTTTSDTVSGSNPGFPYEKRHFKIEGIDYIDYNKKAKRKKRELKRKIEELMDLVDEAHEYINDIDDSLTRQILSLRYINGLGWTQVAASIGGGNTADSVRMIHNRFFNQKK